MLANLTAIIDPQLNPTPFSSSLLDYRIEIGKDMTEGGGQMITIQ